MSAVLNTTPLCLDPGADAKAHQFLLDVMTTSIEGGINYWAEIRQLKRDEQLNVLSFSVRDDGDGDPTQRIKDEWTHITPFQIGEAIKKILDGRAPIHSDIAGQFIGFPYCVDNCDVDSEGADCAVQIACFGKVELS